MSVKYCKKCKYELITTSEIERDLGICDECWFAISLDERKKMIAKHREEGISDE